MRRGAAGVATRLRLRTSELTPTPDARTLAARALELARAEPKRARAMAEAALRRLRGAEEPATRTLAHRALAVAAREVHDFPTAREQAEQALALASGAGLAPEASGAAVTLASILLSTGALDAALDVLDRAAATAGPADRALVHMQRAYVLQRADRLGEASEHYGSALAAARRSGDALTEALTLGNRGILLSWLAEPDAAARDLLRAEELFTGMGMELNAADVRHNHGFAAATAGRLAEALRDYQSARQVYGRLDVDRPEALLDEARALLELHLVADARHAAAAAVAGLRALGQDVDLGEALLVLAEAGADAGAAAEAHALFARQDRPRWAALSAFTELRLRPSGARPAEARAMAAELAEAGWLDASLEARLLAATTALDAGDRAGALGDLGAVAEHRRRGPAARRLRGWYALALLRRARGDDGGASRAAAAGVRVASANALALAATELRARAGVVVEPLVDLGIELALEARRPRRLLVWAERWRAGGLAPLATELPADDDLAELRSVMRRLDDEHLPTYRRAELDHRRRRLEADVDRRARAVGAADADRAGGLDVDELVAALGDRTLVEFVVHDGQVHPVAVDRRGVRMRPPAPLARVVREVRALRMAASRLARPRPGGAMGDAAAASARILDELLLDGTTLGDEVVLVPTGALHAVPWPLLPSIGDRVSTVAPSARLWLQTPAPRRRRRALVVAHGVPGGGVEAEAVAACYPEAEVLDGDAATTSAVLDALAGVDVAHLAVHATFRADNPLYSSLQLADGPLLVHDLDRLRRTPPVVVLSACGAGQASVEAGDELLGLAATFLRSGTTSLVASTLPVADELAPPLMAAFHQALRTARPAVALRQAGTDAPRHAGAAFTCFGRG
jgi:Tfp pilus assembly protein PilF